MSTRLTCLGCGAFAEERQDERGYGAAVAAFLDQHATCRGGIDISAVAAPDLLLATPADAR